MAQNKPRCIALHAEDNVAVALTDLKPGDDSGMEGIHARQAIPPGHKIALEKIKTNSPVLKYGQSIGVAARDIEPGAHVHLDNLRMGDLEKNYTPGAGKQETRYIPEGERAVFKGYKRSHGRVGTRNYIGVLSTVSCSSSVGQFISDEARNMLNDFPNVDGVIALGHGGGCCTPAGTDGHLYLQRVLAGYAENPNFGGVLIVGLGCETNLARDLISATGIKEGRALKSLVIQDQGGTQKTVEAGVQAIESMLPRADAVKRKTASLEHLVLGLECGGSDAYSGITANPAMGAAVDMVIQHGGTAVLGETPEIYGAEHLLIKRAADTDISDKLIQRIIWWENYTALHQAGLNNNPTPGNKEGGITTILEKSMGAVAKAGSTNLNQVYEYAEKVSAKGLVFMDTPGYDVVSLTGMIAGGANMICFTTGRGTVAGFRPVPTLKLASNSAMYQRMSGDMDVNCGMILDGHISLKQMGELIFREIIETASGKQTKSEKMKFGGREFVPWPMGAVL